MKEIVGYFDSGYGSVLLRGLSNGLPNVLKELSKAQ